MPKRPTRLLTPEIHKLNMPKISIDQKSIQDFFKTDRGILLISMGISLFFWLLIKLSQDYKANREVSIQYQLPEKMVFAKIPPKKLRVTLGGRGWDLMYDYFSGQNSSINFDLEDKVLQNITNNQIKGKITTNLISSNINITDVTYDYIPIELDKSAAKKIPIILEKELTFATEYQLKRAIQLLPDSVTLFGPISLLEEYDFWSTSLLSLQNLQSIVERPLTLQPTNKEQLQLSESVVQVRIPVEQFTEKSFFLPVTVKNAPDSLKIFPNKVKISFVVGLSLYDTIAEKHFQLEVDLKGISLNQTNNTAPISLIRQPEEVKNIRFSPNAVSFLYVKE